jgi:predicted Zn-dependent protease
MGNEKRLEMLRKIAASPEADSFAQYALAMEYRSSGRLEEALEAFRSLRTRDPEYLAMYLMCGTMLVGQRRTPEARDWFEAGLAVAKRQKNSHAVSEIEAALDTLDDT